MRSRRAIVLLIVVVLTPLASVQNAGATDCVVNFSTTFELRGTLTELEHVESEPGSADYFRAVLEAEPHNDRAKRTEFAIVGRPQEMELGEIYEVTIHDYSDDASEPGPFNSLIAYLHADSECSPTNSIFSVNDAGELETIDAPKSTLTRVAIGAVGAIIAIGLAIQQARSRLQTNNPDTL